MIAGSKADTLYMTKDAFAKATGTKDKELFLIDGAIHIETYWVPSQDVTDGAYFHSRLLLPSTASSSNITRSGYFRDSNRVIR